MCMFSAFDYPETSSRHRRYRPTSRMEARMKSHFLPNSPRAKIADIGHRDHAVSHNLALHQGKGLNDAYAAFLPSPSYIYEGVAMGNFCRPVRISCGHCIGVYTIVPKRINHRPSKHTIYLPWSFNSRSLCVHYVSNSSPVFPAPQMRYERRNWLVGKVLDRNVRVICRLQHRRGVEYTYPSM